MNATKLYKTAPDSLRADGASWYRETGAWCYRLGRRYHVPRKTVAAIVAVLSQRKRWRENRLETVRALRGHKPKALGTVADKVQRLLAGEDPRVIVRGQKIRAFWRAILGDRDAVVLDVWMLRAYGQGKKALTELQYRNLADRLRRDARRVGAAPVEFQAVVWCMIRGAAH